MASLSEASDAVKGLSKSQVVENLVAPHRSPHEFDEAFEKLRTECWYLHRKENDAWYFSRNENLKKKIEKYATTAAQPKIDAEMERRLKLVFEPKRRNAYTEVLALPKVEDVKTNGGRVLLVLSPDKNVPPDDAERLFKAVPEKNNFMIVSGDGTEFGKLEDKVRRIWATAKVLQEDGGDRSPNLAELQEEAENAEFEFNSTLINLFNRIYYPARLPKGGTEGLTYVALKLVERRTKEGAPTSIDGEAAIEDALTSTGASKLIVNPGKEPHATSLRTRAQDLLWGTSDRKTRWRDVEERALSNVRWPWLPPKGLDDVKRVAVSIGEWKDPGDGYVEKGPFPKAKTSVKTSTRSYNDDTGLATIELTPTDAGKTARVHFASTADVSSASPIVPDLIMDRDETALWFLAVDPTGEHETGEPVKWTNQLTLTHQPHETMGKRTVALTVKPRGSIRWNTEGTNPREGTPYAEPIPLPGKDEIKIYAFAEDAGIETTKTFTIPAAAEDGIRIDPNKPVVIRRKQRLATTKEVFEAIKAMKDAHALLKGNLSVTAGRGEVNVAARFGPQATLDGGAIEAFLTSARSAIGQATADVDLGFGEVHFETGRDMEEFLAAVGWSIEPSEVEQS